MRSRALLPVSVLVLALAGCGTLPAPATAVPDPHAGHDMPAAQQPADPHAGHDMAGAPAEVPPARLKELHLRLDLPPKVRST